MEITRWGRGGCKHPNEIIRNRNLDRKHAFHSILVVADDESWLMSNLLYTTLQLFLWVLTLKHVLLILPCDINVYKVMQSEKLNSFPHSLRSLKGQEVASFCTPSRKPLFLGESRAFRGTLVAGWLNCSLGGTGIYTQKYAATESLCIVCSKQHYP